MPKSLFMFTGPTHVSRHSCYQDTAGTANYIIQSRKSEKELILQRNKVNVSLPAAAGAVSGPIQ